MIPIKLTITGFLSYQETTELDFTQFDLARIDPMEQASHPCWMPSPGCCSAQARKRDESLINLHSNVAEVALVFEYESNTYRVQRTLPKGKTTVLELDSCSFGWEVESLVWSYPA